LIEACAADPQDEQSVNARLLPHRFGLARSSLHYQEACSLDRISLIAEDQQINSGCEDREHQYQGYQHDLREGVAIGLHHVRDSEYVEYDRDNGNQWKTEHVLISFRYCKAL
jgi:hypothetical protein